MWNRLASVKQRNSSHQYNADDTHTSSVTQVRTASRLRFQAQGGQSDSRSHYALSRHRQGSSQVLYSKEFLSSKCRISSRLRVLVPVLVLLKFLWNISLIHEAGFSRTATQTISDAFVPSYIVPSRQIASSERSYQNGNISLVLFDETYENDEEILAFVEAPPIAFARRRSRGVRIRPPMLKVFDAEKYNNGNSESFSVAGALKVQRNVLDVSPHKNWTVLCAGANLDSDSKVVISGALSNPLGHALALLIGEQCYVDHFLIIDSLYPAFQGSERMRLAQLDRYKTMKRYLRSVQLLTPPLVGTASVVAWHRAYVQRKTFDFEPSHLIHLETSDRMYHELHDETAIRFYSTRTGLMSLDSILGIQASLGNKSSKEPKLVYATACDVSMSTSARLQSVLVRSYLHVFDLELALFQTPCVYGPWVGGLDGYEELTTSKRDPPIYVDDALSGILRAFASASHKNAGGNQSSDPSLGASFSIGYDQLAKERAELELFRINETRAWIEGDANDLGGASVAAEYYEVYGVPRTRFPCSSSCESVQCLPLALDKIQNVSRAATSSCDYVLYVVDASRRFSEEYLYRPRRSDDESEYTTCRVAFVSGRSRVTRKQLLSHEDYVAGLDVSEAEVQLENGKHYVKDWLLIFLPDFSDDEEKDLAMALLRIDPSRMLHRNVVKALYTEIPAFMKASVQQLETTFDEMTRYRTGKYFTNVRRRGVNGVTKVLIPSQKSRKVIFYAREPKPFNFPDSLADFVANARTSLSQRQIEFYEDSAVTIPARLMRTSVSKSLSNRKDSVSEIVSFPFQWLSSNVYVHDLKMRHSHEFRCRWLQEFLFWGGSTDAERLSFAYIFGKLQVEQKIGHPLVELDEPSWIPLLNPTDPERRLRNANDWEVFIRIVGR